MEMKMKMKIRVLFIIIAAGLFLSINFNVFAAKSGSSADISRIPAASLSDAERKGLLLMREEEKLARDVYLFLYDKHKINIFKNISSSEQQHMDSLLTLLNRYKLNDPIGNDEKGKFMNSELQALYNDLTKKGASSAVEALKIGATIEDLDIKDLRDLLKTNDNEDIKFVYDNLMKGSRNHLRSFIKQLKQSKADYSPQYISRDEFDAIVNSSMETGGY